MASVSVNQMRNTLASIYTESWARPEIHSDAQVVAVYQKLSKKWKDGIPKTDKKPDEDFRQMTLFEFGLEMPKGGY